jgi:1,4-dihydroxy-2-naphthoyl-CoA hydrolase
MIWKNAPSVEGLNMIQTNSMGSHLGIEFTEIGDEFLIARMPVDHRTRQPMGLLHGGASVALAETLGSVASVLLQEDISQSSVVGVEINANHLSAAKSGFVSGKVSPIKIGRTIHVWNIEIVDETGKKVCISRLTTMILNREK